MYREQKILQMIAYLLKLNNNEMNMIKLMKELYLIDRESISERNCSVSGDTYYNMKHGPVLSGTYNNLNELDRKVNSWDAYLKTSPCEYYPNIILTEYPGDDWLSQKDKEYITRISEKYFDTDRWILVEYTHTLDEWQNPGKGCDKIKFQSIMKALGKNDEEIDFAKTEYDQYNQLQDIINNS